MKTCPSPTGFFKIDNLFGELWTERQKALARHNLGITKSGLLESLEWGNITGDISNQKDLLELAITQGIPILTLPMYDELEVKPEKYVIIPDESELNGVITNKTYTTTNNGNYVDILFSAIRSLLTEVAKLKNSFYYGIQSYNDEYTTSSQVINSIEQEATEPLWAIDPEDLLNSDIEFIFTPETNYTTNEDTIIVQNPVEVDLNETEDFEEAKLVLRLIVDPNNLWECNILTNNNHVYKLLDFISRLKCNILFIISRKVQNLDDDWIGKNYVWCSITNMNNQVIKQGYIKNNLFYNNEQLLEDRLWFKKLILNNITLYKYDVYLKNQSFTNENDIPSSIPDDSDFTYKAAHITIRSVNNLEVLRRILDRLLNNELIWVESINQLYIKSKYKLIPLNGGSEIEDDMGDVIQSLKDVKILTEDSTTGSYKLNDIASINFIHEGSGKTFQIGIDSEGNMLSLLLETNIAIDNGNIGVTTAVRGAFAHYNLGNENYKTTNNVLLANIDTNGAFAKGDRIRISSWYIPSKDLTNFNCTHSFVELTNCSSVDYPLSNACISFVKINGTSAECNTFNLKGTLKAGSTYLIRGSKLLDMDSPIAHIKVEDYDIELWLNKELFDMSTTDAIVLHHENLNLQVNDNKTILYSSNKDINTNGYFLYVVNPYLLDVVGLTTSVLNYFFTDGNAKTWVAQSYTNNENSIIKDLYLLDPAKQAFRSLTSSTETSNIRVEKVASEVIPLEEETISFPHSDEKIPVTRYAPKASKYNKNISTDKTNLDFNKPNFVTCAFGINGLTTRCFNWVSVGLYDEFIWIRKKGNSEWKRFESYKSIESVNTISDSYPRRKEFSVLVNNTVYARMNGTFPGNNIPYTAHKVILDIVESPESNLIYEYIVGRSTKSGYPNAEHCSEIYTFTMHDSSWTPIVFQTTDQQGFGWMEYQVWAAAAKEVLNKINEECSEGNYYPVFINTGDMTQNGTRVNEWLDYYNGGKEIFRQYEQMCVVGNNDLCDSRGPLYLGTGDDFGKSNPYYFHLFYCYEINDSTFTEVDNWLHPLIYNNIYIPSTYYFTLNNNGYLMVNSEITETACNKLWKAENINLYTGFNMSDESKLSYALKDTITNMLTKLSEYSVLVACHEMPFTVVNDNYLKNTKLYWSNLDRSLLYKDINDENSVKQLIGSHLNRLSSDTRWDNDDNYWFSKLLQDKGVKLCIGGHKHTYACTYPIVEYDEKYNNTSLNLDQVHLSKRCIIKRKGTAIENSNYGYVSGGNDYFEFITDENLSNGVTYFMLQATGYKIKSNKELPSRNLMFSMVIPETNWTGKITADVSLEYPMYAVIKGNFTIDLYRVANIKKEKFDTTNGKNSMVEFSQINYSTDEMVSEKLLLVEDGIYYKNYWLSNEKVKNYNKNVQRCYYNTSGELVSNGEILNIKNNNTVQL